MEYAALQNTSDDSWFLLLLVGVAFLAAACSGANGSPDLVLHNAHFIGLPEGSEGISAVALGNHQLLALGSDSEILALAGPETQIVDLAGASVGPAFVDHHVHLLNLGLSLQNSRLQEPLFVDLTRAGSLPELIDLLQQQAESKPAGSWILGKGWSQVVWGESSLPSHHVLSRNFPDQPVFLTRVDGHAGWANQEALRRAGITQSSLDPPGGRIVRLPDGEPSGVLLERANELMAPLLPPLPDEVVGPAFRTAAEALAERGFTRVYDAGFLMPPGFVGLDFDLERILDLLVQEHGNRDFPIDINLMVPAPSQLAEQALAMSAQRRRLSDRIRITHLKLFADGAMGSRGAALSHPFSDQPDSKGVPRMTREKILDWTLRGIDAGLDVATHAIGDAAVGDVLEAYARVLEERPDTLPGRLRIEHFSYASRADMERAATLGIVLSVQPNFIYPDATGQTMEDTRVGLENSRRVYAWGSLDRLGARLAGGSDYFALPGPPLQTFHSAVTRANPENYPPEGWHAEERLSPPTALDLMGRFYPPGGAAAAGGLRAPGAGDLVILSDDPLTRSPSDALQIRVIATLKAGRVVFSDGTLGLRVE